MDSPTVTLTNIQETIQETVLDNSDITEMDSFIPKDLEMPVIGIAVSHRLFVAFHSIPFIEDIISFFLYLFFHSNRINIIILCSLFCHRLCLRFSCFWV
jgi:hypothetical protein